MGQYDNPEWKYLPTYPEKFIVPRPYISKREPLDRLVVLVYLYGGKTQTRLWRTGPGRQDPCEDEWVPRASMRESHIIVEVKNKGIGPNKNISQKRVVEMDTASMLKESMAKMLAASYIPNEPQKWVQAINTSRWFEQTAILISEADFIAQRMRKGVSATLICDSEARGAQLGALVQVIMEPEYRSFTGFEYLVEKEFLQYGNSKPIKGKDKEEEKGLHIIQFLDCVYQLTCIYPLSFEFNEYYLAEIARNVYSNRFGNFLYCTRAIYENTRAQNERTASIWRYLEQEVYQYRNSYYVDYKDSDVYELRENISVKHIRFWQTFFLKILNETQPGEDHLDRHCRIAQNHLKLKKETEELRKRINEQHANIAERKKVLKELKELELE